MHGRRSLNIYVNNAMRVIVSDSSDFVGNVLIRLLEEKGVEIVLLNRCTGFDLSTPDVWEKIPVADHFIHLENLVHVPSSYVNPYLFYRFIIWQP